MSYNAQKAPGERFIRRFFIIALNVRTLDQHRDRILEESFQ